MINVKNSTAKSTVYTNLPGSQSVPRPDTMLYFYTCRANMCLAEGSYVYVLTCVQRLSPLNMNVFRPTIRLHYPLDFFFSTVDRSFKGRKVDRKIFSMSKLSHFEESEMFTFNGSLPSPVGNKHAFSLRVNNRDQKFKITKGVWVVSIVCVWKERLGSSDHSGPISQERRQSFFVLVYDEIDLESDKAKKCIFAISPGLTSLIL